MVKQENISNAYMKILQKYNLEVLKLTESEIKASEEHFRQGDNLLKTALLSGGVVSLCVDLLLGTDISVPLVIYSLVSSEGITCSLAGCKMMISGGLKQTFNKGEQQLHFEKEISNRIYAEIARTKARVLEQVLNFASRLEAGDVWRPSNKISNFFYKFYREKFDIGVIDASQLAKKVYSGLSEIELSEKKAQIEKDLQAAYKKLEVAVASKVLLKYFKHVLGKCNEWSSVSSADLDRKHLESLVVQKICSEHGFDLDYFYDICNGDVKSIRSFENEISREIWDLECDLFLLKCMPNSSADEEDTCEDNKACIPKQPTVGNSKPLEASQSPVVGPTMPRAKGKFH